MHNEKEDGSRSLGRSSDTVYYDGSVPTVGEEKERGRDARRKESDSCIHGRDSRLWRDQNRPLFVTSGYLAGHFRTRVGTYSLPTVAYQIFRCSCSKLPSNIIASCSTSRCRSVGYVFEIVLVFSLYVRIESSLSHFPLVFPISSSFSFLVHVPIHEMDRTCIFISEDAR